VSFHTQELHYTSTPDKPDAVYALKLQVVLGGQLARVPWTAWGTRGRVEELPEPSNFPIKKEAREVCYQYLNCSDGRAASEGSSASGSTPDGKGQFTYHRGARPRAPDAPGDAP